MPNHEEYPVRRGSLPLVDEDVDGLRVDEDLLMVGHGVHILGGLDHVPGGRYFECRTTRNIWSGVAPPLLDDEDEAVLLDEDA